MAEGKLSLKQQACTAWANTPLGGRAYTKGVCYFQFFIGGVFFGLSPLILPVSATFDNDDSNLSGGVFFFGFAVMTLVYNLTAVYCCYFLGHLTLKQRQRFVTSGLIAWPFGLLALTISVQFTSLALLLGLAFPLLGFAVGVEITYLHLVEMATWWGDKVNVGHAMTGGASAVGALVWTLTFGEIINVVGIVPALWICVAVHTTAVVVGVIFLNPAHNLREHEDVATEVGEALSLMELARDWRVYVFTCVMICFFFAGISMKTLLSVLFEEIFEMSYIEAVRYSAGCLSLYVFARSLSPLVAAGDNVFAVFLVVLVGETVAYALTPWAVKVPGYGMAMYTAFRIVGGAGFAILLSTTTVLLVRLFGPPNVARVSGLFLAMEWLPGLGPSIAYVMHVEAIKSGETRADSWNPMFYFNAVLAASAAVGVILLRYSSQRSNIAPSKLRAPQLASAPVADSDEARVLQSQSKPTEDRVYSL